MKILKSLLVLLVFLLPFSQSWADGKLKLQKVTEDVYAIVGELGNRTAENLGNNATFGFVVTTEGVVLIDSGATYKGAQKIDLLIKKVTDKPVVTVINTGGQDHRWLGNGYFKKQGAQIIASEAAVSDQKVRTQDQFISLGNLVGDEVIIGTDAVYAEKTFKEQFEFKLGDTLFKVRHSGQAHTPGDSFIWLPQKNVMFTGDIVYTQRMPGVGSQSNSKSWIDVYQSMAAYKPKHVVPGHGQATDLSSADADTYDYLVFLRESVSAFIESGGDITDIGSIDQSKFSHLLNYKTLAGRNAQQVYTELEWE
ncbi:MAG: MBL fold metallo-hydrolase [Pseudomonadota bacterium]|nr:MBL fold metallo-hydrolase [Pseudomonadota bacterium]